MKTWTRRIVLVGAMLAQLIVTAEAAERRPERRYRRGSFFETVMHYPHGVPQKSKAYVGYRSHFPPPAWLYYGYPHSGDGSVSPGF
jgi:hypothetical protein